MRSITQLKSLGDLRTTISTHARSTPRLKGSTYLEVYLLDKEKQRLEAELTYLGKRQGRIEGRMGEIRENRNKLVSGTETVETSPSVSSEDNKNKALGTAPRNLKTLLVGY